MTALGTAHVRITPDRAPATTLTRRGIVPTPRPAPKHRDVTVGGVLLSTGAAEQRPGLYLGHYLDGSRSVEVHGRRRFLGLYR